MISAIAIKGKGGKRGILTLISAVSKAVMLDIDLAISAYYEAMEAEKASALSGVADTFGQALEQMGRGNLCYRIEGRVSTEFRKMQEDFETAQTRLLDVLRLIRHGADDFLEHSQQTAKAVYDLSSRTVEQAASLEETAAQTREINKLVQRTTGNSQRASQLVTEARTKAQNGGTVVEQATTAMSEIQKVASEVSQILGLIDDIAEQTNILSLNAAIEAARAGSLGKGFSVVAEEVRSLAARSSEAAGKIGDLIKRVIQATKDGTVLVEESKTQFHEVADKVTEVEMLMTDISDASLEQAQGIDQITIAVSEMNKVTTENAAMVQDGLTRSKNREDLARDQIERLSFFKIE
jgi:methyl-accepting chemotaxis protein